MGDTLGGGVMVAVAAALWIAYLLPSWLHRRQFIATERNAVRLQQTLRILAETAETPEQVRVEATARSAASQERVLRDRQAAERAREKAAEKVAEHERRSAEREAAATISALDAPRRSRMMRRRMRALASLALLASLGATVGGVVVGIQTAGWTLALGGVAGIAVSFTMLSALAQAKPPVRAAARTAPESVIVGVPFVPLEWEEAAPVSAGWTPQPLPKPLHLAAGTAAATAMGSVEAGAALRRAAVFAAMSERAAEINEQAVPLRPRVVAAPAAATSAPVDSRFASMGFVEDAEPGMADLDAVLRRRRVS